MIGCGHVNVIMRRGFVILGSVGLQDIKCSCRSCWEMVLLSFNAQTSALSIYTIHASNNQSEIDTSVC